MSTNTLSKMIEAFPSIGDQFKLVNATLVTETALDEGYRQISAWAAAIATRDKEVIAFVKKQTGELNEAQKRTLGIASSRMSVTNPYFMGRSVTPLNAGGDLESIYFSEFSTLGIEDELAYHYVCISFSLLNKGYMCYRSHISSLQSLGQSDEAIDQALRLSAGIASLRQAMFNVHCLL